MSERAGPSMGEIKSLLQANVDSLARALAPRGSRSGKWWLAHNPTREDAKPSLGIGLTGNAPGAWKDFATGEKGDVFDLIAYVNGFPSMKTKVTPTMQWAREWLGLDGASPPEVRQRIFSAKADAEKRAKYAEERAAKNARRAKAFYLESRKHQFVGSPAARYLASRGLDIARLPRLPGCLGWLPEMWHSESDTKWPAMIACFTGDDGSVVAIHRTYLALDGSGKAPVKPVRKIWPQFAGSAIRLWRGASGLPIDKANEEAEKHGTRETLVIVEGVEDGLSVALSCPDLRIWCAGSLSNLANLKIPPCVDEVIICADNDWGKAEARAALDRGIEAIAAQGVKVKVARSTFGKDVNDALVA